MSLRTTRRALETPRLLLRATVPAYADGLWDAISSSVEELKPWMAWAVDPTYEATLAFARGADREWDERGWVFTVFRGDEVIGTVGLDTYQPLIAAACIGYWIRSDLAGSGLTTEAAAAVIGFAFDDLGLHRLELHAAPGNAGSLRVAEKLGFQPEGLLREASRGAGGFHDVRVFGLLATDPRPRL